MTTPDGFLPILYFFALSTSLVMVAIDTPPGISLLSVYFEPFENWHLYIFASFATFTPTRKPTVPSCACVYKRIACRNGNSKSLAFHELALALLAL